MASIASLDLLPGRAPRPGHRVEPLLLRLRVGIGRFGLDRRLAAGEDPGRSPELALRARQITTHRAQLALAMRIERILREADRPEPALTARAPLQRAAVHGARPALLSLVDTLRAGGPCAREGMARVHLLLSDGCGALWAPSEAGTLDRETRRAINAL
jgi:hypothetical protein